MTRPCRAVAILSALLTGGAAFASCEAGETVVLSCDIGRKTLDLCILGDDIRYRFGPPGAPELQLTESVARVRHEPWQGVGRSIWEATTLVNGDVSYEVDIAVDRMAEDHPRTGGVTVTRNAERIAALRCDEGTAEIGIWAVTDAKEARGICWQRDSFAWGACAETE